MSKTTMLYAATACAMALEARDVSGLSSPSPEERPYGAVPSASQLSRDEMEKMLSNDFAKDAEARRTDDGVELAFAREVEFNVVRLMEDCRYGQRIDDFAVDYFDGEWKPFAKGQAVGIRRLLRREETVKATKVRLRIVHCEMTPLLKDFSVMRCGLKRNAWFKDFEKRSFSKDRTIEGRQVKIDLDPNVGKGRYRIDADGDGFRISAFDEECAQAAIRELCAKLRGESAAAPRSRSAGERTT